MQSQVVELAAERQIALRDQGVLYRFTTQPISSDRWQKFFEQGATSTETRGNIKTVGDEMEAALVSLATDALLSATGYKTAAGAPLAGIEGWRDLIPRAHRLRVGRVLAYADAGASEEAISIGGGRPVALEVLWTANKDGLMERQTVVHRFSEPSFEHERKYRRAAASSVVVGGSRNGKTIWMGAQKALMAIYDELITGVDGYSYNGEELGTPARIAQYMDAYHKCAAAVQLFAEPVIEE